ncbi:hypothetical protein TD95_004406 [Thielaviopsis punctulata]|uniref:JmjC domain-containing protein n=1 Tax=Thielaviopsis punctulata TaxID=72032 RepID=A0A0F4ZJS5_9PEZI|nr:hypothetical protein TD95_004406 [Thielaviopsis punctulata]
MAITQFYAAPFSSVLDCWRRVYADTRILMFHIQLLESFIVYSNDMSAQSFPAQSLGPEAERQVDVLVEMLDMAIIISGGNPVRARDKMWMNKILELLQNAVREFQHGMTSDAHQRPLKRIKTGSSNLDNTKEDWDLYPNFSSAEPFTPPVTNPIPQLSDYSITAFQTYLSSCPPDNLCPVIFTDLVDHWPALTSRPWRKPAYLLRSTFDGRRLVPVEIGRSYVDADWGQKLIPFKKFLSEYIDGGFDGNSDTLNKKRGYLAQHDLFAQIPSLRQDITIPDLCWSEPPLERTIGSGPKPEHSDPRLNAWFGPAGTITPLHTDSTHNILVQVVGRKYVRLYHPKFSTVLQPRKAENGIDMSNTANIDIGIEEGWDILSDGDNHVSAGSNACEEWSRAFKEAEYWDCILEPGQSLYIPYGWWHYVRSLSISFSVSFWWT